MTGQSARVAGLCRSLARPAASLAFTSRRTSSVGSGMHAQVAALMTIRWNSAFSSVARSCPRARQKTLPFP